MEEFSSGNDSASSKNQLQLNPEQLQHLLNRISSDEQKELQDIMKGCSSEVLMTRGLPFSLLTLGSVYIARTRLPPQYHFGPKGWPFYAIIGIGSLTVANIFGMGMCKERIQPKIHELWNKYELNDSKTSYEDLRAKNRQRSYPLQKTEQPPSAVAAYSTANDYQPQEYPYQEGGSRDISATALPSPAVTRQRYQQEEQPVFMSGTPARTNSYNQSPSGITSSGSNKKNQYGDSDFS